MLKKFILMLCMLSLIPAYAGEFENALNQNQKILLYIYGRGCRYCMMFSPVYNYLSRKYGEDYKFLKYDMNSSYGTKLMIKYRTQYVPFVVVIDPKAKRSQQIPVPCLIDTGCAEVVLKNF